MPNLKTHILATTCLAIAGSALFAADAFAATTPDIYGAGSSLVAPYFRQAMDCYGEPTALIFKGTPPTFVSPTLFNYVNPPHSQDCSTTHFKTDRTVHYISTGSGTGIAGIFSHDPTKYGFVDAGQTQYFPEVHYGLSDAGLAASDVAIYNNGGTEQGVVVVAPNVTPGVGQYGNPKQLYGPMVQFPISVDPVAVAYDPVYKKVFSGDVNNPTTYKFNIHVPRADGSGGLRLDATTYCKIFNGQITNWNDPALKTLNGNKSLEDPSDPTPAGSWSVPMQIVGRSDSSGTTSIFTRHLANVCASISGNNYADGATTLPSGLFGVNYDKTQVNNAPSGETLGKFTEANGSDGVAKYVAFTTNPSSGTLIQGRLGYMGPDFALPAVLSTGANTYGLNTANLKNSLGQFEAPTAAAAQNAFATIAPPQSDASGHYDNSQPGDRTAPDNWVQPVSKTSPLANPTTSGAYPMMGTTNFIGYTCYKNGNQEGTVSNIVSWYMGQLIVTDRTNGLLAKAGLAPVSAAWRTAIKETFTGNTTGLGLNFAKVGAAGACSVAGVKGG
jgi:phosphate transport system substrate-binding protein